jgi:hypothetical protein
MLNPTTVLAEALGENLAAVYRETFSGREPIYGAALCDAAKLVIERIASSDALYHDTHHTAMVTLVAQDILRGLRIDRSVTPSDWYHFLIAALMHDVGYLRGVCLGDTDERFVADMKGSLVTPPRGASDAFLTPYHVDRSKLYVLERFKGNAGVDGQRIARAIEMTRFPILDGPEYQEIDSEPALLRAADLIGQLADPLYPRKLTALYYEFVEIGYTKTLGYQSPADLIDDYPRFFWNKAEPYLGGALRCLDHTIEGKQWIANLYSHVFATTHQLQRIGPQLTSETGIT